MRVVSAPFSDVVTASLSDVAKTLPQCCYNVGTTLSIEFLSHFNADFLFPSSERERVTKVLSGIKHTPFVWNVVVIVNKSIYKPREIYQN